MDRATVQQFRDLIQQAHTLLDGVTESDVTWDQLYALRYPAEQLLGHIWRLERLKEGRPVFSLRADD